MTARSEGEDHRGVLDDHAERAERPQQPVEGLNVHRATLGERADRERPGGEFVG